MNTELSELKKQLQELTKKYGLDATMDQQKEVIKIGKRIEELESQNTSEK